MLIPLDYYRILGLPIPAGSAVELAEQLDRSYEERLARSLRPEYSRWAVTARRELIEEAYRVLSDPASRELYDAKFLSSGSPTVEGGPGGGLRSLDRPLGPGLDIDERQFVGALMLLQDLGEYEATIQLGYPQLSEPTGIESGRFGDPRLALADIVLAVVLSYLELGREQWQHQQSEPAAGSLKIAQELLLHHGLFVTLRAEIQADLYKLRPYRIVELLGAADLNGVAHRQGLQLLRDMLKDREGLDGKGDDRSGLNTEDFLRFVQQVRSRLTAQEQLALFEAEARRPSAVATYLAAYALIAQGFSQQQPSFIQRASLLLRRLGSRQDVHLEQAVCGLLLGRPEEATRSLELSRDQAPLAAIQSYAPGTGDLLPGLCAYAEHWLKTEVYPHFRDLAGHRVSLTDYFADPGVQAYLETLPEGNSPPEPTWAVVPALPQPVTPPRPPTPPALVSLSELAALPVGRTDRPGLPSPEPGYGESGWSGGTEAQVYPDSANYPASFGSHTPGLTDDGNPNSNSSESIPGQGQGSSDRPPLLQPVFTGILGERPGGAKPSQAQRPVRPAASASAPPSPAPSQVWPELPSAAGGDRRQRREGVGRAGLVRSEQPGSSRRGRRHQNSDRQPGQPRLDRLVLALGLGLATLTLLGWAALRAYQAIADALGNHGPLPEGEQPALRLDRAAIELPEAPPRDDERTAATGPTTGPLTTDQAANLLKRWLAAKSAAMGPKTEIDGLSGVLVGTFLSTWQANARQAKTAQASWEYEHQTKVKDVKNDAASPDRAIITAEVKEAATLREKGQVNQAESYNKTLQVRYTVERSNGQWKIAAAKVL